MRFVFLAVLGVLLVSSFASADLISNVSFTGDGLYKQATNLYIIPDTLVYSQMTFNISQPRQAIRVNFGTLNNRGGNAGITLGTSDTHCNANQCTIPVTLYVPKPAGSGSQYTAQYTVVGSGSTQTLSQYFYVDTSAPRLASLGTPTCIPAADQECSLKTGDNTIVARFSEQGSGMLNAFLVDPSNAVIPSSSCNHDNCTFSYTTSESNGEFVFKVLDTSQDKSGNKLGTTVSQSFRIDNTAPKILSNKTAPPAASGVMTGPFTIDVEIQDDSPSSANFNLTEFNTIGLNQQDVENDTTVTCSQTTCTLQVSPPLGTYTVDVPIKVTDSAGNSVTSTMTIRVARTTVATGVFWDVTASAIGPSRLDKGTSEFFTKRFFLPLTLTGPADAEVTSIQVNPFDPNSNCQVTDQNNQPITVGNTAEVQGADTSSPVLLLTIPQTQGLFRQYSSWTQLRVKCAITVYTIENGLLHTTPEQHNVTGTIQLVRTPLIVEAETAEIQKESAHIQSMRNTISGFTSWLPAAETMCQTQATMALGSTVMTSLSAAVSAPPLGALGGASLASGSIHPAAVAFGALATALGNNSLGKLCPYITCESDLLLQRSTVANSVMPLANMEFMNKVAGWTTYSADPNHPSAVNSFVRPDKSIVVAFATGCIPAIVQHVDNQIAIDCNYQQCLNTQATAGLPISACGAIKSKQECEFIYSGVFYTIPYLSVVQTIHDNVFAILSNPVALLGEVSTLACKLFPANPVSIFQRSVCEFPLLAVNSQKLLQFATKVSQTLHGNIIASSGSSACSALENPGLYGPIQPNGAVCYGSNLCCYGTICKGGSQYYTRGPKQPAPANCPPADIACQVSLSQNFGLTAIPDKNLASQVPSGTHHILDPLVQDTEGGLCTTCSADVQGYQTQLKTDQEAFINAQKGASSIQSISGLMSDPRNIVKNPDGSLSIKFATSKAPPASTQADKAAGKTGQPVGQISVPITMSVDTFVATSMPPGFPPNIAARINGNDNQPGLLTQYQSAATLLSNANDRLQDAQQAYQLAQHQAELDASDGRPPNVVAIAEAEVNIHDWEGTVSQATNTYKIATNKLSSALATGQAQMIVDKGKAVTADNDNVRKGLQRDMMTQEIALEKASLNSALTYGATAALSINYITSTFGLNNMKWMDDYRNALGLSKLGEWTDLETAYVNNVCSDSGVRNSNVIALGAYNNNVGLFLQGTLTRVTDENGVDEFEYLLSGDLLVDAQKLQNQNISYHLYLKGTGSSDITLPNGDGNLTSDNNQQSWLGPNIVTYSSPSEYRELCIKLGKNLHDLFPTYAVAGPDACVNLNEVSEQ